MPKGKDLDLERGSSSKALPDGGKQRENDRENGFRKLSWPPYKFNQLNQYRVFGRDRSRQLYLNVAEKTEMSA